MPKQRRRHVLVVEDDPEMRAVYNRLFERARDEVQLVAIVPDGEQAIDVLKRRNVDVVVLDWALPGLSGISLLRALRADNRTCSLGVLMVTALSSKGDELTALTAGADDHLVKPFDGSILLARLRALFRRQESAFERRLPTQYPGLEFEAHACRVRLDGKTVRLTPKETDLMGVFLQRPDVLHTPAFLWSSLWGHESDSWNHLLVATLSSLRRKLGPKWGARLRAHRGKGYVFERGA